MDTTIDVPVGAARTFTALVKTDIGGSFTGTYTTDVSGATLDIAIDMAISSALISGTLSAAVSKPGVKAAGGKALVSTWAGATVEVIDSTGALVGTGVAAADGTYSVDVPDGVDYFVRAQIGNMVLKAYVPSTAGAATVSVNATSTAAVMVLAQALGVANLGDSGVSGAAAIAATDIATLYTNILADPNLAVAAAALASEIETNYDPAGSVPAVGSAGIAATTTITQITQTVAPPATTVSTPAAPTGVSATAGNAQATVSWTAVTGATSYNVYYSTTAGVTPTNGTKVAGATSGGAITGLTNGTTYYFVVTAVNAGGEGPFSTQVSATPQVPAPAAPGWCDCAVTAGDQQVGFQWTASATATSYNVYYGTTSPVTAGKIRFSSDGIAWSAADDVNTNRSGNAMYNVVWAGATAGFRSVGLNGTHDYSPDGITWWSRPQLGANLYAFAYSGSMYVTVGQSTSLYSSPISTVWIARVDPTGWGYDMLALT